ncbi:hypothetical protein EYR41_005026 [Orbilia oligospora]|uniref:Uncharacterized protein n=1 Tax=Orbilia oligospora TaxID=2813651 RepID=A0A7C8TUB8_ORBOL|nr:hypothetical protein TWF751_009263 [Orbilia oligospora]TGJ68947.1 hypothetical protein EYR41_005026 [Orbilia oligospora]
MGNTHSAHAPRRNKSSTHSRHPSSPTTSKKSPSFRPSSSRINNKLSKPKVGGESPPAIPIPLPASLSRRNSKASIRNILPDRANLNSTDGGTIPYPRPPTRSGSVDLSRQDSFAGAAQQGWSNHPSRKASRETINGPGGPGSSATPSLGAVWLERRRSLVHDPMNKPGSPPTNTMSPVSYIRPMTAPAAENSSFDVSPLLEPDDLRPPPTASSTASFHSALQSPTRIQLTPSPTKFLNSQQQQQQQGHTPPSSYNPEPSHVPVRRRSLLQAAAPGTATRPKVQEPEPNDMLEMDDNLLFVPKSRFTNINTDGARPETPQDQGTLGSLRKGSLFVANGAPSPIPSSPSLRATSGGSERPRDSSLLSLPPVSATTKPEAVDNWEVETLQTPTMAESFAIKRKPVGTSSLPSSPQSGKRPVIQVDTSASTNLNRQSLRLVPPSPDTEAPDTAQTIKPQNLVIDGDEDSTDEDPHRRHLFTYGLRNKQFLNGQFQPSPSSDYSNTNTSAVPSVAPSAKPGLSRSPFSFEGAKLLDAPDSNKTEAQSSEGLDARISAAELEQSKPKPLVIRKSLPHAGIVSQAGPSTIDCNNTTQAAEEKLATSSDASDVSSDQSQASQIKTADSGYSSAGSAVLPPDNHSRKAKHRQSAPEQIAIEFHNQYPEMRPATSHNSVGPNIATSVVNVPYSSVRNRTPPTLQAPPPRASKNKGKQYPPTQPAHKFENAALEDADEAEQKKPKRKRRLSFKRLSWRGDKKPEIEAPEQNTGESSEVITIDEPESPKPSHNYLPPLNIGSAVEPEHTQYQLQPQPERQQSFTSSVRSGLQSIGYAPEAASLPTSPVEPSYHEPMAITSSTPSRAVLALRSSESVSYTGAAYYQRFNTPSPVPGNAPNTAAQSTPSPPAPQPVQPVQPVPQKMNMPERQPSLPRHTTPPSSYKPPPGRYSMEDNNRQPPPLPPPPPQPQPQQQRSDNMQVRRRPLGNSAIKSNPQSPVSTTSPWNSNPSASAASIGSVPRVSRTNSMNSQYSYNTQSGYYQPNSNQQVQRSDSMRSGRPRYSQNHGPQSQQGQGYQGSNNNNNGVLPFATGQPRRQRSTSSGGSVGPGGYPHLGQDHNSDSAMFGMDFWDGMQVKRANDLVKSYGSTNPPNHNGGGGGNFGGSWYGRRRSTEQASAMELLYGEKVAERYASVEMEDERRSRKRDSFWKKAAGSMGRRSKSQHRGGKEAMGY